MTISNQKPLENTCPSKQQGQADSIQVGKAAHAQCQKKNIDRHTTALMAKPRTHSHTLSFFSHSYSTSNTTFDKS
jgi:hypothetical protein